jgi:hypothetical protein
MPPEIDEILFKGKTDGPLATGPDRSEVLLTGHNGVVVLDDVIDGEHAKAKLLGFKSLGNQEVSRDERGDRHRFGSSAAASVRPNE